MSGGAGVRSADRRTCTFQPGDRAQWVAFCWSCTAGGLELARALVGEPYRPPEARPSNILHGFGSPARSRGAGGASTGSGLSGPASAAARTGQSERSERPAQVWAAAGQTNGTPGAAYLASRGLWLGEEHPAVRWLPGDRAGWCGLVPQLPWGAAGCLVYLFRRREDTSAAKALQVEAVDVDGRRVQFATAGKRPSVGGSRFHAGARVFVARPVGATGRAVLCEGPIDGLALCRLLPPSSGIYGVAGTSGMTPAAVEGVGQVVIAEDVDPEGEGQTAARRLAAALERAGRQWRIIRPRGGLKDWGEVLEGLAEREAMRHE